MVDEALIGIPNQGVLASGITRGRSEASVSDRENENRIKEERFDAKKQEAVDDIKSGKDAEGKKLYSTFLDSLTNPDAGDTSILYTEVGKSVYANKPGEMNKTVVVMDALYKKLGMEGYKITTDEIPADLSPDERQKFLKDKITQDYGGLADKLADKFIGGYAESLAELNDAKDKLRGKTSGENFSRAEVRSAAYEVEDKKRKILHVVERSSAQIGSGEDLKDEIGARESATGMVVTKEFGGLSVEEQNKLIERSIDKYKQDLGATGKQQEIDLLNRMNGERRNETFAPIAEADQKILNLKQELDEFQNSDPSLICQTVSEIKELQLEKKALVSLANISLAEQRAEEAKAGWEQNWDNTLNSFVRGKGRAKALEDLINAGKEWLSSQGNLLTGSWKKGLNDSLNVVESKVEEGGDVVAKVHLGIVNSYDSEIRDRVVSVKEKISDVVNGVKDKARSVGAEVKSGILSTKQALYEGVHGANILWHESKVTLYEESRRFGLRASVKSTALIGEITGRDLSEKVERRLSAIERFSDRELEQKIETIKQENKDNPYFERFTTDLEKRLGLIKKAKENATEMSGVGSENTASERQENQVPGVEITQETTVLGEEVPQVVSESVSRDQQPEDGGTKKIDEVKVDSTPKSREDYEKQFSEEAKILENQYSWHRNNIQGLKDKNQLAGEVVTSVEYYQLVIDKILDSLKNEEDLGNKGKLLNDLRNNIFSMSSLIPYQK